MDKYQYLEILRRLKKLEKDSHPRKELHEFEVYPELIKRLEALEEANKNFKQTLESLQDA